MIFQLKMAFAPTGRCRLRREPGLHTCSWGLRRREQDGEEAVTGEAQARVSWGSQSTRNSKKPEAGALTPPELDASWKPQDCEMEEEDRRSNRANRMSSEAESPTTRWQGWR